MSKLHKGHYDSHMKAVKSRKKKMMEDDLNAEDLLKKKKKKKKKFDNDLGKSFKELFKSMDYHKKD